MTIQNNPVGQNTNTPVGQNIITLYDKTKSVWY